MNKKMKIECCVLIIDKMGMFNIQYRTLKVQV